MKLSRRRMLQGLGGVMLGLPVLEGLLPRKAQAAEADALPFAIFLRQADGVAAAQSTSELGNEPERFWPEPLGNLSTTTLAGKSLVELADHRARLLVVRNVNMKDYNYGDGHARGALQCLTARGPAVEGVGGDSEASGESLDHRIGRELNPQKRDSLYLYAGQAGGWLGGPCISHRGSASRRAALHDPWVAYQTMVGGPGGLSPEAREQLLVRQKSLNDLVSGQLKALQSRPELSSTDKQRLDLHLSNVRDLEVALSCRARADEELRLQQQAPGYNSTDGDEVLATVRLHMDIAVLAVACGTTRSVAIQVGNGNDSATRYRDPTTGQLMENFHYISHRRASHDASGGIIAGSDVLHSRVDAQFAQTFNYLLDQLAAYSLPNGKKLVDQGVSVWFNDLGNGPAHSARHIPFILAGSCNGYLKQGVAVTAAGGNSSPNLNKMLNTLGAAVGLKNAAGGPLDDFGDSTLPKGLLTELLA
ncbi:DUF1552 domain-containing protein [Corallococcus sp. AB004]|uniref:DUF1552 domain-containing protein n=1 Tax=Corallococcus TaxID=83461 RepID=UPI000EA3B7D0|nr:MULTISPECIES: DUF1552 domain-containing protein [unclassified Corallococcus]NNB88282.1 DUF1552 domain-containing protein [Corallococcus exiguus]RKI40679.1 DUF1552 domain-containing protein [Corallococcus sp. AB004]NNB94558.1 DUF1552 domain-containing protein [Corallococcus exiguus]NPC48146.1 DUF1552 domain-containing protein [Corallococcus exiguus]NPD25837.1 DUF1552 domain-containing protein [Corallococcus exiguus]